MGTKIRTALISGGTRGIGLAIAVKLAQNGYQIATFARTQNQVDAFLGKMEELKTPALAEVGDVRDQDFLSGFIDRTLEKFGGLDVLVNNAGGGKKAPALDALMTDWDHTLDVNLRGSMHLTKLALTALLKSPGAAIINIVSMAAKSGIAGNSAYCATKFGLLGFSHALFEDLRHHGIKVCAICPGYVDTSLIPNRKALVRHDMIQPDDIAKTVEYILNVSGSACPVEILIRPQRNPFKQ